LNRGDRIISINGKKIANDIDTVEEAMDILDSHSKITLFVLRPKTNDEGLLWVNENFED
jgi:S1-C subfamily serine protease